MAEPNTTRSSTTMQTTSFRPVCTLRLFCVFSH